MENRIRSLLVSNAASMADRLMSGNGQRVLGLDISASTVGVALSDSVRRFASPFGMFNRINPEADAKVLHSALTWPDENLNIGAVVVGVKVPIEKGWHADSVTSTMKYVESLLPHAGLDDEKSLKGLVALLFWNEADVVAKSIASANDFQLAAKQLGPKCT